MKQIGRALHKEFSSQPSNFVATFFTYEMEGSMLKAQLNTFDGMLVMMKTIDLELDKEYKTMIRPCSLLDYTLGLLTTSSATR